MILIFLSVLQLTEEVVIGNYLIVLIFGQEDAEQVAVGMACARVSMEQF